jgi:hypothetical protein
MISRTNSTRSPTRTRYTLTLIYRDGRQTPVGELGYPMFEPYATWTRACGALSEFVLRNGGVAEFHGVVVVTTQARGDELLVVSLTKYNRDELHNICSGAPTAKPPRAGAVVAAESTSNQ